MLKKLLISIIILYFLTLVQTSFLVHFIIWGMVPNLILLLVIVWNIFEKTENKIGLYNGIIGGFFLDIFSNCFIGFNILILLVIVLFIKFIFRRYVRIPFLEKK